MQKIECELCGSHDFLRTDDGFFECQHCGCKYTLEQAKTILSGTIEVYAGRKTLEQQLSNAQTQLSFGEYKKVLEIYDILTNDFPNELIVWESLIEAYYSIYQATHLQPPIRGLRYKRKEDTDGAYGTFWISNIIAYHHRAIQLCKEEKDKQRINQRYNEFLNQFYSDIQSGAVSGLNDFEINGFPNGEKLLQARAERESKIVQWKKHNKCLFCGGSFSMITHTCKKCGKMKTY